MRAAIYGLMLLCAALLPQTVAADSTDRGSLWGGSPGTVEKGLDWSRVTVPSLYNVTTSSSWVGAPITAPRTITIDTLPGVNSAVGVLFTNPDEEGFPLIKILKDQSLIIEINGAPEKAAPRAAIEVDGSTHCLLQYGEDCVIRGNKLTIE